MRYAVIIQAASTRPWTESIEHCLASAEEKKALLTSLLRNITVDLKPIEESDPRVTLVGGPGPAPGWVRLGTLDRSTK